MTGLLKRNLEPVSSKIVPRSETADKCCYVAIYVYVCIQPRYLAKNCRASYRGQESKGSTTHKKDLNKSNARQITVTAECGEDQPATNEENSQDPLSLL